MNDCKQFLGEKWSEKEEENEKREQITSKQINKQTIARSIFMAYDQMLIFFLLWRT